MRIVHLYHDLMNLYGEYGNIRALTKVFQAAGQEVLISKQTITGKIDLSDADFIYMGSGTEKNQKLVLNHLRPEKKQLEDFFVRGGVGLFTGNACELLGKKIIDDTGREEEGLNFFGVQVIEQKKTRITGDVIADFFALPDPLVGFINKCTKMEGEREAMFTLRMGPVEEEKIEGIWKEGCMGTYITGPILVKNPHFLFWLAEKISKEKLSFDEGLFKEEFAAYHVTLEALKKRIGT